MDIMIPELELQHELQRFTARFVDRITQGAETLQASASADVRDESLRKNLLYASSALEIATGPSSPINLLDMFVFVRLCRAVLEKHWIPTMYGEDGADLATAFVKGEDELRDVADRALGRQRRDGLEHMVDGWLADNPGQTRVEGVRLGDFAAAAGGAAQSRALEAKGLLSGVKTATAAANQAMVMAERGMFLVHRLPTLWRLQMRLGVREVLGDTVVRARTGHGLATAARLVKRTAAYAAVVGVAGLLFARRSRRRR